MNPAEFHQKLHQKNTQIDQQFIKRNQHRADIDQTLFQVCMAHNSHDSNHPSIAQSAQLVQMYHERNKILLRHLLEQENPEQEQYFFEKPFPDTPNAILKPATTVQSILALLQVQADPNRHFGTHDPADGPWTALLLSSIKPIGNGALILEEMLEQYRKNFIHPVIAPFLPVVTTTTVTAAASQNNNNNKSFLEKTPLEQHILVHSHIRALSYLKIHGAKPHKDPSAPPTESLRSLSSTGLMLGCDHGSPENTQAWMNFVSKLYHLYSWRDVTFGKMILPTSRIEELFVDINNKERLAGATAVFLAAQFGHADCLRILIQESMRLRIEFAKRFSIEKEESKNVLPTKLNLSSHLTTSHSSPLHVACEKGFSTCVRQLLLLDRFDEDIEECLIRREKTTTTSIKDEKQNETDEMDAYKRRALEINVAASQHQNKMNKKVSKTSLKVDRDFLIEPANTEAKLKSDDGDDATPLFIASVHKHVECVKAILEFEEKRHQNNKDRKNSSSSVVNARKSKDGCTSVFIATQVGAVDCLRELIFRGKADVNIPSKDGTFPLFVVCATHGNAEIVRLLCQGGANVNEAKPDDGATSVFVAAQQKNIEAVKILVKEFGANIDQRTKKGATALHVAAELNLHEVVELLLELGADANAANNDDVTPIFIAVEKEFEKIVSLLVEKGGADPSKQVGKAQNLSPLFVSAFRGKSIKIFETLLSSPIVDPNVQKIDGATPVFAIAQENRPEFLKILLKHPRTDPNIPMKISLISPLFIAISKRNFECVKLLAQDKRTKIDAKNSEKIDAVFLVAHLNDPEVLENCFEKAIFDRNHPVTKENYRRLLLSSVYSPGFFYGDNNIKSSILHICCEVQREFGTQNEIPRLNSLKYFVEKADKIFPTEELKTEFFLQRNGIGCTSFFVAALYSTSALEYLISNLVKNNSNTENEDGKSSGSFNEKMLPLVTMKAEDGAIPLFAATMSTCQKRSGALERMELLLKNFYNNNDKNKNIKFSFNIDEPKNDGAGSLFMACQMNCLPAIEVLLKYGASPLSSILNGSSCLHVATECGHVEVVQKLLQSYSDNDDEKGLKELICKRNKPYGMTAFWVASANNRCDVVRVLMNKNKNEILLEKIVQEQVYLGNRDNRDSFLFATTTKTTPETTNLNTTPTAAVDSIPALWIACQNGHLEMVKTLVNEFEFDIVSDSSQIKQPGNVTPLMVACATANITIVEFILQKIDEKFDKNDTERTTKINQIKHGQRNAQGHNAVDTARFSAERLKMMISQQGDTIPKQAREKMEVDSEKFRKIMELLTKE